MPGLRLRNLTSSVMTRAGKVIIFVVFFAVAQTARGDEPSDVELLRIFSEYQVALYNYMSPQNVAATRESERAKMLALKDKLLEHGDKLGETFIRLLRDANETSSEKVQILDFMRYYGVKVPDLIAFSREVIEREAQDDVSSALFVSSVQTLAEFGGDEDLALLDSVRDSIGFSRILDLNVEKLEQRLRTGEPELLDGGRGDVQAGSGQNPKIPAGSIEPGSEIPIEPSETRSLSSVVLVVFISLVAVGIVVVLLRSRKGNPPR